MSFRTVYAFTLICCLFSMDSDAAPPPGYNYDEAKVPAYTLPEMLVRADGGKVSDSESWTAKRRPEILRLFEEHVYGRMPRRTLPDIRFEVTASEKGALGGIAIRKEITVYFTGKADGPKMQILLYLPQGAKKPVPVFLGLNFQGNHAINSDPGITLSKSWMRNGAKDVKNNLATEASRGAASSRWPVEKILNHGYGLATIYYGDIEPDHTEGWTNSLRSLFQPKTLQPRTETTPLAVSRGRGSPDDANMDDWGAIGAWSWGLSRALDYLEKDPDVDGKRVAVIGHSRLGKTALWAGATDERFALVISNDSGCGGAALSRRQFGETVERINTSFPHWFCNNFKKYNAREGNLPVDQHELIALMAPRPVYVASAMEDQWADPRGEFLSAKLAEPVYKLFGKSGLTVDDMPPVDKSIGQYIGYHIRTGGHDLTTFDWEQYLAFADRHLKKKK